ncbi:amino acid carrier protein [Vibrio sp. V27_P1S3P104]|nr:MULTISPECIES: sodium:alanine symporter family protein [Vibrio]NAW70445.1 amino acid carrier protein [Vibrio sp. V28_P6S34P95]NAX03570.1 amino acid carrier protein [Vibrio sp. V30_P3S12P165]NAX34037.1 amino acid carrier protein [Vibrio sp. V29_P1S30P107]NAX36662.1 amino acid carrier protein [Vibrio sp. V27_P1S3P104]NNN44000.1 sodium:alanine symporter family protein [Vibrio sp. 1-1(7)]
MELIQQLISQVNGVVWGLPMLVIILGIGIYLNIGLKFMPFFNIGRAFKLLWKGRKNAQNQDGEIPPFQALMTALSATIGTGNIAGVATALFIGGPGALFWMWMTALLGMATKYSEAVLAVKYRETDSNGNHVGGPMYYIKNGMGKKWAWLGTAFALFGTFACFGIGNGVQINSIAQVMHSTFDFSPLIVGLVVMILSGAVLLGGIKRIGAFAGALVPLMGMAYVACGLIILLLNIDKIGGVVALVLEQAFTPTSAQGGFAGATIWMAIRFGVARGIFSNEAGLGSAPIAHASAQTDDPVRQGLIAMLGTFIDTIIICSITGFVIIISGEWTSGMTGAELTSAAFDQVIPGFGRYLVTISLAIFAFTTIVGWSIYGERCISYLFGTKAIIPFRVIFVLVIPVGAIMELNLIWLLSDTLNAMMAIPNLIALGVLSPVVYQATKHYFARQTVQDPAKAEY